MRRIVLTGLSLALVSGLVIVIGAGLDLDLDAVALLGAALGAVVALVPDRSLGARLGGFAAGFVVAWIGYAVRAAMLPDTSFGRAVTAFIVVLLCVAVVAVSMQRLPLWSVLLGTGGFVGAYEFTYSVAPTEFVSTSMTTATSLFIAVAAGLFAASFATGSAPEAHHAAGPSGPPHRHDEVSDDTTNTPDPMMMEQSK